MKTFRMIGLMALLCLIMPAFVSCDNDDDDDDPAMVDAIKGTYSGTLGYSVMGYEPGNIDGTYEVKIMKDATDADDVTVVLPECSFNPPIGQGGQPGPAFTIPSLTIDDVDVSQNGNVYTISEDDLSVEVGGTIYTGNITGKITGKDAKIEYTLRPGRMPMDINFTFTGSLK